MNGTSGPVVVSAHLYPIKSCAGTVVDALAADALGPVPDRRFMLVDRDGVFLSQRELPKLARVEPEVRADSLRVRASGTNDALDVPLAPEGERTVVRLWRDLVEVVRVSEEADGWFSECLGFPCRLVYLPEGSVRPVDPDYARPGDRVTLADGFPFLAVGEASLSELNSRLGEPLPMDRFRPNLVLGGTEAFEEDGWKRVRIGELEFRVVKPCSRCVITTVDQSTGEKTGREPLATLATFRDSPAGVLFGQNLIHSGPGTVRVGDAVEVL